MLLLSGFAFNSKIILVLFQLSVESKILKRCTKKIDIKKRIDERKNKQKEEQGLIDLFRGASGLFLKNKKAKTSLYTDSFFVERPTR